MVMDYPDHGSGNGYGYGDGYGSGDGNGDGYGYGSGDGNGNGDGYGSGYGDGYGDGNGDGNGNGDGYGNGYGDGYGSGYGDGDGDGYGNGSGNGDGYIVDHATPIFAWWYIGDKNEKHFGESLTPEVGHVHKWPYRPNICHHGLHASIDKEDARKYRRGTLCRVACSGYVQMQKDKLVCTRREILEVSPDDFE